MVKKLEGILLEITPMNQLVNTRERLIINLSERNLSSIHVYEPRSSKHVAIMKEMKKIYGFVRPCRVLEVIEVPRKKSLSMKTITHDLLYYDLNDLNADFEFLREILINES